MRGKKLSGPCITDGETGLMWQNAYSNKRLNWEQAMDYPQILNQGRYGGFTDWRLPNQEEYDDMRAKEEFRKLFFETDWYWTSYQAAVSSGWGREFPRLPRVYPRHDQRKYVRCVRDFIKDH